MGLQILQKSRNHLKNLGAIMQVPYQGPTVLDWLVNSTIIWCFLLVHVTCSYVGKKNCNNYAKNISCHSTKFSWPGNQMPGICETLLLVICTCYVVFHQNITCFCMIHTWNKIPTTTVILNSKISRGTCSKEDNNLQLRERVSGNMIHFRQWENTEDMS